MNKNNPFLPPNLTDKLKLEPPKIEWPVYDEDCEFVNDCYYTNTDCYAGADITLRSRCSKERINQMIENKELKPQHITVEGSNNVQIAQLGNNSTSSQQQSITIEDLPEELINQFKQLIKSNSATGKHDWIQFLESLAKLGGSLGTLASLFKLFGS